MIKKKQHNQYTYGAYIIPNELTLTCKECGHKQTYSNKYSYRRAMVLLIKVRRNKRMLDYVVNVVEVLKEKVGLFHQKL